MVGVLDVGLLLLFRRTTMILLVLLFALLLSYVLLLSVVLCLTPVYMLYTAAIHRLRCSYDRREAPCTTIS